MSGELWRSAAEMVERHVPFDYSKIFDLNARSAPLAVNMVPIGLGAIRRKLKPRDGRSGL
jgi:hypothetical protein